MFVNNSIARFQVIDNVVEKNPNLIKNLFTHLLERTLAVSFVINNAIIVKKYIEFNFFSNFSK